MEGERGREEEEKKGIQAKDSCTVARECPYINILKGQLRSWMAGWSDLSGFLGKPCLGRVVDDDFESTP